jgi:hypothetical protein
MLTQGLGDADLVGVALPTIPGTGSSRSTALLLTSDLKKGSPSSRTADPLSLDDADRGKRLVGALLHTATPSCRYVYRTDLMSALFD